MPNRIMSEHNFKILCATIGTMSESEFAQIQKALIAEVRQVAAEATVAEFLAKTIPPK